MNQTRETCPGAVACAQWPERGDLPDDGGTDSAPATWPSGIAGRLNRIAELAHRAAKLSGATREIIHRRIRETLDADGRHTTTRRARSASLGSERRKNGRAERPSGPTLSAQERLERLEHSLANLRRTYHQIHRLAQRACGRFERQGGQGHDPR